MKLYQIVAYTLMTTFAMQSSFAATDIQIDFVKKLYQTGKQLEKGTEIIELYQDESLEKAFRFMQDYEGEMCGYHYDMMWQSNDPNYNRKLIFTKVGTNEVKVDLGKAQFYDPSWVIYKLNCKGNSCKINDVIDESGSLKQRIYKECRN